MSSVRTPDSFSTEVSRKTHLKRCCCVDRVGGGDSGDGVFYLAWWCFLQTLAAMEFSGEFLFSS